ncbi:MAG: hypothetical protein NTW76_13800 [Corynebacteriales bacterium]|nr:hypothetical protein [Mycobacteriales bacterium]
MAEFTDDGTDTTAELYEKARRQVLLKLITSSDGEKAAGWASAWSTLQTNHPGKGRSAYED